MSSREELHGVADSDCLAAMDHLYAYLNGELDDRPETFALVKHHLGHCESCFSRAEMERLLNERLSASGRESAPAALKKRLRGLLDNFDKGRPPMDERGSG